MDKKQTIFYYNNSTAIIDIVEMTCNLNNIRIQELNLKEECTLFKIEHSSLTTLLDFTNSRDYQVLYLTENLEIVGGSYAINNKAGFILQTQKKYILLLKQVYIIEVGQKEGNEGKRKINQLLSNK